MTTKLKNKKPVRPKNSKQKIAPDAIQQKHKEYWSLWCISTSKTGLPDRAAEKELATLTKKHGGVFTGSGTCLSTMRRDHSFRFSTKKNVVAFMKDAVKAKLLRTEICCTRWKLDWVEGDFYGDVHYKKILMQKPSSARNK